MSKILCVFAHPDDEAFGPGGTIAKYAKDHEVYIICATRGEEGFNHSENKDGIISNIRENELYESTQLLGVKNIFILDYKDGTLNNNLYHEIALKVEKITQTIQPDILLTFEPRGVSGHIDHVAMSHITSFVYRNNFFVKKLYYYCINNKYSTVMDNYFIYFPEGYDPKDITTTISIDTVWDTKVASMMAHKSQVNDARQILAKLEGKPKEEYFILGNSRISDLKIPEIDLMNGIV